MAQPSSCSRAARPYPYPNRWWQLIERFGITIFYTAPTAIRALMRFGEAWPNKHDLSSLRLLGSVGEPINPEAWKWFHRVIGKDRCPIMDTWWQTETGMFMITPTPVVPLKPGSGTARSSGRKPKSWTKKAIRSRRARRLPGAQKSLAFHDAHPLQRP
jgi:acetyl-CoA synthetase